MKRQATCKMVKVLNGYTAYNRYSQRLLKRAGLDSYLTFMSFALVQKHLEERGIRIEVISG